MFGYCDLEFGNWDLHSVNWGYLLSKCKELSQFLNRAEIYDEILRLKDEK